MKSKSKSLNKILNIILLLIFLFLIILFISNNIKLKQINEENIKLKKIILNKNEKSNSKSEKLVKNENVVFFGDSITEIYPIDDVYDSYQIIKSGVSGYTTKDLLNNINKMVYRYNPTKVILLIGTNNIMTDTSEKNQDKTISDIEKIATDIKINRPKATLYIESIYPVNRNIDKGMVNQRDNNTIKNMNKKIKKYCKDNKITYIDMYDELTDDDGNFDKKYTYDGLHPNTLGYAKITRILTPYIYD